MQTLKITVKIETVCPFCEAPIIIPDVRENRYASEYKYEYLNDLINENEEWLAKDEGIFCGDDCHEKYLSRRKSERREDMEMNR